MKPNLSPFREHNHLVERREAAADCVAAAPDVTIDDTAPSDPTATLLALSVSTMGDSATSDPTATLLAVSDMALAVAALIFRFRDKLLICKYRHK